MKLRKFLFSREVRIESFKIIFTALLGFITFKVYQMYRNKKDNSKLYIKMIKLEREMLENQKLLRDIIDSHSEYHLLDRVFGVNSGVGIYDIYKLVCSLNSYVHKDIIYESGNSVGIEYVYTEIPYILIEELELEKKEAMVHGERYPGYLESINIEIEECRSKSIFKVLLEIENNTKDINMKSHELGGPIEYLKIKLNEFNLKEDVQKRKTLHNFCSQLLDEKNIFSDSLEMFKNYENLARKTHKEKFYRKSFDIVEFKVWKQQEMDLLGVYSLEDYLGLEEYYNTNKNIKIGSWEIEKAEKLYKEMKYIYDDRILKIKDLLIKTLKKTNWIFGNI